MITLKTSGEQDIPKLADWIKADPYHRDHSDPVWWLTGNGVLSGLVEDESGILGYIRFDRDGDLLRMHTQFGPREEVSKQRLVDGMLLFIPLMQTYCKTQKATGIIFESTSPSLIGFMKLKFGFEDFSQDNFIWRAGV